MDRSTRFLSLSGLSGVIAGCMALVGAWLARGHYQALMTDATVRSGMYDRMANADQFDTGALDAHVRFLLADALLVLLVALVGAAWFTWRRGQRTGQGIWDASARRLLVNLLLPLLSGGLFCIALMYHGFMGLVPAATLVFYGLALLNASKYTLDEVRWLGLSEIVLGLVASFWIGAGLLFWSLGFGVLHIFYGALMYHRHERIAPGSEQA
jgi:hypothetical protein